MATSMVPLNIVNALVKALDYLGGSGWTPGTNLQREFFVNFYVEKDNLKHFGETELRAWVDKVAENLNKILEAEGFSLRFDPFADDEFGVLTILDVAVEWLVEGKAVPNLIQQKWPGVNLKNTAKIDGVETPLFKGFKTSSHPHPIAGVATKTGDVVMMTAAEEALSGFDLTRKIDSLRSSERRVDPFSHLVFPMVDFEEAKSLDWLVGLATTSASGQGFKVAAAKQQTKFKMNHKGARVKDTVTLVMRSTSMQEFFVPPLIIDKPFLLWIERPALGKPIFYGYLDESVWKDPGSLAM